ncbi:hypothetical protein D3C79_1119240 [compost metagenome]
MARGRLRLKHVQKRFGAVEGLAEQAARAQQPCQGFAHIGIVVHDVDGGVLYGFHGINSEVERAA